MESTIWRTGGDIIPPVVESLEDPEHAKRVITLKNLLDSFEAGMHPEAQHTGYYNDLDMMVMGMRGMTDAMDRIHMGLWAMASAPLMVGSDLTRLSPATLSLLKNREALAIHNDPRITTHQSRRTHSRPPGLGQAYGSCRKTRGRHTEPYGEFRASEDRLGQAWTRWHSAIVARSMERAGFIRG